MANITALPSPRIHNFDLSEWRDTRYHPRFVLGVLLFLSLFLPINSIAETSSSYQVHWSMPDRLFENPSAQTNNSSLIPVYDPAVQMLPRDGWLVHLDVCDDTLPFVTSVKWDVDGEQVASINGCQFDYKFPEEGVYEVIAHITNETDQQVSIRQEVVVQDWLIIALGDAHGAGEGNPIKPVSEDSLLAYNENISLITKSNATINQIQADIPGLETKQQQRQQSYNDAVEDRNKAETALSDANKQLQNIRNISNKVNSDPSVKSAEIDVKNAELTVDGWEEIVAEDQKKYNNCRNFIRCAIFYNRLISSKQSLSQAKNALSAANNTLKTVSDQAVVKYASGTGIKTMSELENQLGVRESAVNTANNKLNQSKSNVASAENALQQANINLDNARADIADLQQSISDATANVQKTFTENLPIWTATAPSWGTSEPSYTDITLNGAAPGEALRCHRSMVSGQAQAALRLEQADPQTSVTFLHLSCSGASIDQLTGNYSGRNIDDVLQPLLDGTFNSNYKGSSSLPPIQPQLAAAVQKVVGREPDAIIISVGAEDTGIPDIVTQCITGEPCHEDLARETGNTYNNALNSSIEENCQPVDLLNSITDSSLDTAAFSFTDNCLAKLSVEDASKTPGNALDTFNQNMFGQLDDQGAVNKLSFGEKLQRLQDEKYKNSIAALFPSLDSHRIYITEYLDASSDDNGNYCGWTTDDSGGRALKTIPGMTEEENTWADLTVATTLREELKNAVALQRWTYIDKTGNSDETITSASRSHGYCADNNWVVRLSDSLLQQLDSLGMTLPNRAGHVLYQQAIYNQLIQDFYPDGLNMPPRIPDLKQGKLPTKRDKSIDVNVASGTGQLSTLTLASLIISLLFLRLCYVRRDTSEKSESNVRC